MYYSAVGQAIKTDFAMVMGNGEGILLRRTLEEEACNLMHDGSP